jgi:hypothetical protein
MFRSGTCSGRIGYLPKADTVSEQLTQQYYHASDRKCCGLHVLLVRLIWVAGAKGTNLCQQGMAGPTREGELKGNGRAQCGGCSK